MFSRYGLLFLLRGSDCIAVGRCCPRRKLHSLHTSRMLVLRPGSVRVKRRNISAMIRCARKCSVLVHVGQYASQVWPWLPFASAMGLQERKA
jgi:hypothetical protein